MTDWNEAVCQVAPEWWGAIEPGLARPDLARRGCRICPLKGEECLSSFAAGGVVEPRDLGENLTASGLSGGRLVQAINEQVRAEQTWQRRYGEAA